MPPTVTEVKLQNFRGNILDRQFPVQFDPQTGLYSYNYVEKDPGIKDKLETLKKSLKYSRKSSKSLAEIEADLATYLKTQVSAPPPVKGEITQAVEAEAAKRKIAENILQKGVERAEAGIENTDEQREVLSAAKIEKRKLDRSKKVDYAKQQQNAISQAYNERQAEGLPVNIDPATKRVKYAEANQAEYDLYQEIVDAADYLDGLEAKEKRGEKLTAGEKAKRKTEALKIDRLRLPAVPADENVSTGINEKAKYNSAMATYTQLKNKKNKTLNEQNKFAEAIKIADAYLGTHPNVLGKFQEQMRLQQAEVARRKIKELNAKPPPLSPENTTEKARLQAIVTAYNAAVAASKPLANVESANLQVTGSKNIFEEPAQYEKPKENSDVQGTSPERELSNAAFQARQGKAQRVLNYFSSAAAPARLSNEQTKLRNNAQRIIQAFAKIANTSAKPANQNAARKTIKNSNFLNQARKLSIATEGGRRTRKIKRSRHKTYKRKH